MMTRELFDSPLRPMRQPRFSTTGSNSPNENCPFGTDLHTAAEPTFARQFAASPTKQRDRNVLLLLGNKINSSVPGRRSSIACTKDRRALAPALDLGEEEESKTPSAAQLEQPVKTKRSKSLRAIPSDVSMTSNQHKRTLKRL
jgi:hypothetical protein